MISTRNEDRSANRTGGFLLSSAFPHFLKHDRGLATGDIMSFQDKTIDVTCPNCKNVLTIPMEKVIPGELWQCPHCQAKIKFSGDNLTDLSRSIDNLKRTIKNFGK